jgi:hypothetical protein
MFYKYRYVKVRFNGVDRDYYAYERTFLGIFKSYLSLNGIFCDGFSSGLSINRTWLYSENLTELKKEVKQKLHKFTAEITDAETKLERHLGGDE